MNPIARGSGPPISILNAVRFDGTNDFMTRSSIVGLVNGDMFTFSFWAKFTSSTLRYVYANNNNSFSIAFNSGFFVLSGVDAATGSFSVVGLLTLNAWNNGNWNHFCGYFNLSSQTGKVYVNDVDDTDTVSSEFIKDNVLYVTGTTYRIGAAGGSGQRFDGDLSQIYLNFAEALDITNTTNRRQFINANKTPVNYTASQPTGNSPALFFNENAANFGINGGNGGDFTITGALEDVSGPIVGGQP
ncbi:MAG: hypothetical protein AB7F19_07760 [Candidatus Babeliales bacterium]